MRIRLVGGADVLGQRLQREVTDLITERRTRAAGAEDPPASGSSPEEPAERGRSDGETPAEERRAEEPDRAGRAPTGVAADGGGPVLPVTGGPGLLGGAAAIAAAATLRRRAANGAGDTPPADAPVSGPGTAPGSR